MLPGVKVTLILQDAFAASEVPQVLVCAKPAVVVIEVIFVAVLPRFVNLTVWAGLVVLWVCGAKARRVVDRRTVCVGTVTDKVIVRVTFPLLPRTVKV